MPSGYIMVDLVVAFYGCYGVRKNERDKKKERTSVRRKQNLTVSFFPCSVRLYYFSGAWLSSNCLCLYLC